MTKLDTFSISSQALANRERAINAWIRGVITQRFDRQSPPDKKTIQVAILPDDTYSLIAIDQDGGRETIAVKRFAIILTGCLESPNW